jgi:2-methylaconitate cis-trans-isomerase PrpF
VPPKEYVSSSGKTVGVQDTDVLVRAMSMGKLHHAMMGTAAVAIGTAAAIPGTLVNLAAGGGERNACASAILRHLARGRRGQAGRRPVVVTKAIMSRSARADGRLGAGAGGRFLTPQPHVLRQCFSREVLPTPG